MIAALDPVRALRRPLHAGDAGVRQRRRQPAHAARRAREPLLRALARPGARRSRSAGCGCGCSSRSCCSVRCCAFGDPYLREALQSIRRPLMAHHHCGGATARPTTNTRATPEGAAYEHTDAHVGAGRQVPVLAVRRRGAHARRPGRRVQAARSTRAWRRKPASGGIRSRPAKRRGCRRCRGCSSSRPTSSTTFRTERGDAARAATAGRTRRRARCAFRSTRRCASPSSAGCRCRPAEPAQPAALGMMPADSSSGRTMERRRQ